ncbi:hypothetical protein [Campylobacter sp. MG1]|uniref:hypothetical protein n=1 Tax=Campylobacter sp. MG1 TaxID=2976332 RepID=UPI00226D12E9|nr:hypothetical protein [Campylobacter sp. MG1]
MKKLLFSTVILGALFSVNAIAEENAEAAQAPVVEQTQAVENTDANAQPAAEEVAPAAEEKAESK